MIMHGYLDKYPKHYCCMKPSKIKVPQCQQWYIWHCGIYWQCHRYRSSQGQLFTKSLHRPRQLFSGRQAQPSYNKLVISCASRSCHTMVISTRQLVVQLTTTGVYLAQWSEHALVCVIQLWGYKPVNTRYSVEVYYWISKSRKQMPVLLSPTIFAIHTF